ncbi:TPA: MBL fold metallo-hydrolase, partial [Candidatus Poribacteria bacterium]|nr:MBL fold metallo-hydrolase [Candidatus Poribacteria bacterium]HEX29918.1 MBL fold metallo-hydrolase [Candidatus Poribacteria bacterium]
MQVKLSFLGAAQNVTGSRYLLEFNGHKILVDCGLYQERELRGRNWDPFPVPPNTIDAVLLTHAHLDHSGLLPKLVREGFEGRIYCTAATSEISGIALLDSAHLQEEDAEFKRKRHKREGRKGPYPEIPLYTSEDARATFPLFHPVRYGESVQLGDGIEASFHDAGHILGSSMIKIDLSRNGWRRTILFSGDVGRWNKPILRDPTLFDEADYVLVESTYGDRLHEDPEDVEDMLADAVNLTWKAGGNVVIPSFAIERAQEVLYHLNELLLQDRIPHLMVFVDSPMAISVTEVFGHHPELFDEEMIELIRRRESPFDFPGLKMVRKVEESKAINHIRGTVIIIAGSGMCTGGRIKHHLVSNISRPESTILFVGYQAVGTLGRQIVDGAREVRILGRIHPVRARIVQINGFSGHADRDELFRWLSGLKGKPRHLFVTHGEPESAHSFA